MTFPLLKKIGRYRKQYGFKRSLRKIWEALRSSFFIPYKLSSEKRRRQESRHFENSYKISIIVPLYNTPAKFLKEMIRSVKGQTYGNWELCLADGSDDTYGYVGKICENFAKNDPRIIYKKLKNNTGISGNSNAAMSLASGEYIGLLDHDDLLHPSALFEVMTGISEKNADFIYTDEAHFMFQRKYLAFFHFKPDYSVDLLRGNNYICHFSVFSRGLIDKTGGFRSEFDGSQDHDLILRLTEKAEKILHIPKVLYYWRVHYGSVAADIKCKPYALDAGKKAVLDSLKRAGLPGSVESDKVCPYVYRIKYKLRDIPLVSIVISGRGGNHEECISSIYNKTNYKNFEIITAAGVEENMNMSHGESAAFNSQVRPAYGSSYYNLINKAAEKARGSHIIFISSKVEIITEEWIEELLMYAQREDVGAVGGKVTGSSGRLVSGGIVLGLRGGAASAFEGSFPYDMGYAWRLRLAQNVSAVSRECMMTHKDLFTRLGGFRENFANSFGDIDYCLRLRECGLLISWTPHCETRLRDIKIDEQSNADRETFRILWEKVISAGDPYYNPNLTLKKSDFSYK